MTASLISSAQPIREPLSAEAFRPLARGAGAVYHSLTGPSPDRKSLQTLSPRKGGGGAEPSSGGRLQPPVSQLLELATARFSPHLEPRHFGARLVNGPPGATINTDSLP